MTTKNISLLLLIVFIALACSKDNENDDLNPKKSEKTEQEIILDLVNEYRQSGCECGTEYFPPTDSLVWDDLLENAAQHHADDMHTNGFFSHTGSDGKSADYRIAQAGYEAATWGENIAHGYHSEEAVVQAWINSEAHCKNIMKSKFTDVGVAKSGSYWAMVLAKPK